MRNERVVAMRGGYIVVTSMVIKAGVNLKAVFTPLEIGLMEIDVITAKDREQ